MYFHYYRLLDQYYMFLLAHQWHQYHDAHPALSDSGLPFRRRFVSTSASIATLHTILSMIIVFDTCRFVVFGIRYCHSYPVRIEQINNARSSVKCCHQQSNSNEVKCTRRSKMVLLISLEMSIVTSEPGVAIVIVGMHRPVSFAATTSWCPTSQIVEH